MHCYPDILSTLGRHAEALALMQQAAKRNPLSAAYRARAPRRCACMKRDATRRPKRALKRALEHRTEERVSPTIFWGSCIWQLGRAMTRLRLEFDRPPLRDSASDHAVTASICGATEVARSGEAGAKTGPRTARSRGLARAYASR